MNIQRIQSAVEAAQAQDVPILRRGWGVYCTREGIWLLHHTGGVDPLGALLLHEQPGRSELNELGQVATLLAVPTSWILEFRQGFYTACPVHCNCYQANEPYRWGLWFQCYLQD